MVQTLGVVFEGPGVVCSRSIEIGELGPHDVLLRIAAATVCGTDYHIVHGTYAARPPVILGHEFAGHVVRVGQAVSGLDPGQLVSVEPHHYCGRCRPCRRGKAHLCLNKRAYGVNEHGGMAELAVVDAANTYPVPPGVSAAAAAMAENVGCCLHGIARAGLSVGDDVVIMGAGAVGLILIQLARMRGAAHVWVVEPQAERRQIALELGADVAFTPEEAREAIHRLSGTHGADVVIEASGAVGALEQAIELAGSGATILQFGVAPPEHRAAIAPHTVYAKELTIVGSNTNPASHDRAVAVLPRLQLDRLVSEWVPLERAAGALVYGPRPDIVKLAIRPES